MASLFQQFRIALSLSLLTLHPLMYTAPVHLWRQNRCNPGEGLENTLERQNLAFLPPSGVPVLRTLRRETEQSNLGFACISVHWLLCIFYSQPLPHLSYLLRSGSIHVTSYSSIYHCSQCEIFISTKWDKNQLVFSDEARPWTLCCQQLCSRRNWKVW